MSVNERPGVYTNINVSGGILGSGGGKAVIEEPPVADIDFDALE